MSYPPSPVLCAHCARLFQEHYDIQQLYAYPRPGTCSRCGAKTEVAEYIVSGIKKPRPKTG